MEYSEGDLVLVESFAGVDVKVRLLRRFVPRKNEWGASGWDAVLVYKSDVLKLIKKGVPYKKDTKPKVWVFDWEIIKKIKPNR